MDAGSFPHQVTRLVFDTGQPYVPLRTVICAGPDDRAFFAADQPSTEVSSFGLAAVTEVGADLDRKLSALLRALGVPAGEPDGRAHGGGPPGP